MLKRNKTQWFTLVELVVVATIVAILSSVWFVAYTWYISWARDANRISQLASITDGLNVLTAQSALPFPEDKVDVIIWWEAIAYQWYAWQGILDTIGLQKWGKDPKDDIFFTYYLDAKRSSFQLMALLEEQWATSLFNNEAYANDYSSRVPTVYGQKLWVLTDEFNTPIQEIETIKAAWSLSVSSTTTTYKAHISETEIIEWTSSELIAINPETSCERIQQARWSTKSTYYTLNPLWDGVKYRIFCNMNGENPNVLVQNWEVWIWTIGWYSVYLSESENERKIDSNPIWANDIIWESTSTDTDDQDGWWTNDSFTIDTSKTYRVSAWFKKIWNRTTGVSYLWTRGPVLRVTTGASTTNPYFWLWDLPDIDKWYLVVGYIHPIWYTGTEVKWWIYATDSIDKVANTDQDFIHESWNTIGRHRAYLRIINDSSILQQFYDPRYEEIPASKVGDVSDLLPVRVN